MPAPAIKIVVSKPACGMRNDKRFGVNLLLPFGL
jgi:hypothetical protein